jgi:hypothetical protein
MGLPYFPHSSVEAPWFGSGVVIENPLAGISPATPLHALTVPLTVPCLKGFAGPTSFFVARGRSSRIFEVTRSGLALATHRPPFSLSLSLSLSLVGPTLQHADATRLCRHRLQGVLRWLFALTNSPWLSGQTHGLPLLLLCPIQRRPFPDRSRHALSLSAAFGPIAALMVGS